MSSYTPDPRYSDPPADAANAITLPIFAVISSLFIILPFRAFWLLRNFPSCSLCVSLLIINLSTFLNAVIWNSDDWTTWWAGHGLCDIESTLRWPITLSVSTALCCFVWGLANALDTEKAIINPTKAQRRRHLIIEILFVWGPPVMVASLHYVVQVGRYAIIPVFGCTDELDDSWPYMVIVVIWGPIFSCLTSCFAVVLLYRLRKHRKTIASALSTNGSGMVPRKFIKLALISLVILIVYLPVQVLFIFRALPKVWIKYDWKRVHDPEYWGAISYYHTQDVPLLQYSGWATISYGFLMLPFYGFNTDAIRAYRRWLALVGFGKCFPCLEEPYSPRGRGGSSTGSSSGSRTIGPGTFDLFSKIMNYFDIETDTHPHSQDSQSRLRARRGGNSMSFGSATLTNSSTISGRNDSVSAISPAYPKQVVTATTRTATSPSSAPTSPPSAPPQRNRFATIRSWNPFAFLVSQPSQSWPQSVTDESTIIVEDKEFFHQMARPGKDLENNNVFTTIWSPAYEENMSIERVADPSSPPLGSRAYRERERREMEREKMERDGLAQRVRDGAVGVVVQTQLERREEGKGGRI